MIGGALRGVQTQRCCYAECLPKNAGVHELMSDFMMLTVSFSGIFYKLHSMYEQSELFGDTRKSPTDHE